MGYIYRKVLFYQLQLSTKEETIKLPIGCSHDIFVSLIKDYKIFTEDGFSIRSTTLEGTEDNQITLDVIYYNNDYAFCRMGRTKDINSIQKRNRKDLTTEKITLDQDQYLEVFSYFLLDFKTGIISYMYSRSAPNIKKFHNFYDDTKIKIKNNMCKLESEVIPIPNDNVLSMMEKITYFSALEARFTVPAAELFKEKNIQLRENEYLDLSELDSDKITLIIAGGDEKMKINNYTKLKDTVEELYSYKDGKLEKLSIKANVSNQRVETINLLQEQFNRQVSIRQDTGSTYIPIGNIKDELEYIYYDMKKDLEKRVKVG